MTGTDLIVLAPWIVFIAGLAVICVLLLRSRRASGPGPSGRLDPPGAARRAGNRVTAQTHRKRDVARTTQRPRRNDR